MDERSLLRALGVAAIVGGVLRIGSAFVPWEPNVLVLELLYFVIDAMLLFGLMGAYLAARARIGVFGFVAFAIAEIGIAAIVGPDTTAFSVDIYQIAVLVITAGLTLFAIQLLVTRAGPWWAPGCWIASTVVGVGATAGGAPGLGFMAGGVLFGLGFVAAGVAMLRPSGAVTS